MKRCGIIRLTIFFLAAFLFCILPRAARAVEAPGIIIYEREGKLWMIQSDGEGQKILAERGATSGALVSHDGKLVAYPYQNKIYLITMSDKSEKLIYEGAKEDKINLYQWLPDPDKFVFRKRKANDTHDYFLLNIKDMQVKELGNFFESPMISPSGTHWAFTTLEPGKDTEESQIYVSEIEGDNKFFVFQGAHKAILGWDRKNPVLLYTMFDKIYAFDVINRQRQIIRLPFKNVVVVAYNSSGILYYNKNQEEETPGIMLYDPQGGEEKRLIETKKTAYLVTQNEDSSKLIFFAPLQDGKDWQEGDLYLFESEKGEAAKLTRDVGRRVMMDNNFSLQWSPDGKYFAYQKLKMKHSKIKRSDIWIAGEGKDDRLKVHAGIPVWGNIK